MREPFRLNRSTHIVYQRQHIECKSYRAFPASEAVEIGVQGVQVRDSGIPPGRMDRLSGSVMIHRIAHDSPDRSKELVQDETIHSTLDDHERDCFRRSV